MAISSHRNKTTDTKVKSENRSNQLKHRARNNSGERTEYFYCVFTVQCDLLPAPVHCYWIVEITQSEVEVHGML